MQGNTTEIDERNLLRLDALLSHGYGLSPQLVMRSKGLSIEAKALYGYLSSFAGAGDTAFPSTSHILEELDISKNRFYKIRKELVSWGFISIETTATSAGLRTVYTLPQNPIAIKTEIDEIANRRNEIKSSLVANLHNEDMVSHKGDSESERLQQSAGNEPCRQSEAKAQNRGSNLKPCLQSEDEGCLQSGDKLYIDTNINPKVSIDRSAAHPSDDEGPSDWKVTEGMTDPTQRDDGESDRDANRRDALDAVPDGTYDPLPTVADGYTLSNSEFEAFNHLCSLSIKTVRGAVRNEAAKQYAKLEKKDVLTVTTTVVDSNILPNASLDNLWADDDGDGMSDHADALRANAVSHAILYDLNEDSDYYVGYAGSRISGATLADWGASENNADAKMRDGFVFDDATGLIYVPKKYTEKNKKGELKVASSRIQLLYATADKGAENSISVKISEDGVDGDVAENGTAKVDILATDTKIVLAKDKAARESLKDSSIDSVIANGIEYTRDMDMWSYDEGTGTLDLKLAPAGVRTVKVKLTNDTGKTVGNFLTSIATKAFAGNVNNIGTWKFNTAPYVGMTFHTAGHNKYTGTATGGHTMPAVENPSGGRYEAKTIYQALGTQGVDVSALQSGNYSIERTCTINAQTTSSGVEIPNAANLNLTCGHVGVNPSGQLQNGYNQPKYTDDDYGQTVRVAAVYGKMNVWYKTDQTPSDYSDESGANQTLSDGHGNPWLTDESNSETLGEDGRKIDYTGWKLWKADVSTTEAEDLKVSDLELAEGEHVTAIRFEYGRVESGFTTREDDWDRDGIKDSHDDVNDAIETAKGNGSYSDGVSILVDLDGSGKFTAFGNNGLGGKIKHKDGTYTCKDGDTVYSFTLNKDGSATAKMTDKDGKETKVDLAAGQFKISEGVSGDYAPAIVHMKVTDDYRDGDSLENYAKVDLYRNGGGEDQLEDHDDDKVKQTPKSDSAIIGTTLTGEDGKHAVKVGEKVELTDTVSYTNIEAGVEHTVTGTLMDKTTGAPLSDGDGNPLSSSVTFTPEEKDGTVEVKFTVDTTHLDGHDLVAFETLTTKETETDRETGEKTTVDKTVAEHKDIDDANQTVTVTSDKSSMAQTGRNILIGAAITAAVAAGAGGTYIYRKRHQIDDADDMME